ncbi:MAG: glutamyl-tRNA reductase [Acidimicrobiales bacterium]
MSFVVVGLSHRTAPLGLLERMTIPENRQVKALGDLGERPFLDEAVLLSTCHRVEVYAVAERFHGAVADVRHFLSELAFVPPEDFSDQLYVWHDEAALAHLFGVAAGLDSVVLGEDQILGQVRTSWERARAEGVAGTRLAPIFRHSMEVGKRARSASGIHRGVSSLSQVAVALAEERLGGLAGRRVLVLGAGEMGEGLAADVAGTGGQAELAVASRSGERARRLAARVGARPLALADLAGALVDADVLFTCTGAPSVVVTRTEVEDAILARDGRPLLVVDLGMPRDVDPSVGDLPGVTRLDLGDLSRFVGPPPPETSDSSSPDPASPDPASPDSASPGLACPGLACPGLAASDRAASDRAAVRMIVAEEVSRYLTLSSARRVAPTVAALRRRAEALRAAEMAKARGRMASLPDDEWERVESLTKAILAKLLHEPTVRLKEAGGTPRGERLAGTLQELFDL